MSSERVLDKIRSEIEKIVPKDAEITKIEFEGPEVAIYSKNITVLTSSDLITQIARTIRKRVVIRSDPKIRKSHEDVRKIIEAILERHVEIGDIDSII